jgi:hypothetical protein
MTSKKRFIFSLLILLQGLIIILLLQFLDYNNNYLIIEKIFLFIYFITSIYLINNIYNYKSNIKKEDIDDPFHSFDIRNIDKDSN